MSTVQRRSSPLAARVAGLRRVPAATASICLCGIPIALVVVMAWVRRWVTDDAFIDLRVVANIHHGLGPVWNAGERVEAYTSPLWVAILWLVSSIARPVAVEWIAVILGIAATTAGLCAAARGAWLLWRSPGTPGVALPLGLLVFCVLPPVWDFATSGLETGLTFTWLGGCFWLLVRLNTDVPRAVSATGWRRALPRATPTLAAVAIGLGVLVRPDLGIFSVGFMIALLLSPVRERRLSRLRLVGWAVLAPVVYEVFRMGYFAALEPNTALAKEAGIADWSRGWTYLTDFLDPYKLLIPLALLFVYAAVELRRPAPWARGRRATAFAAVACGLLHALYIVRLGGDFMHGRMLLPSLFGVLLPVAVVPAARGLRLALPVAVVAWAAICAVSLRVPYAHSANTNPIADERSFYVTFSHVSNPVTIGDYGKTGWARAGAHLRRVAQQGRGLFLQIPFTTDGNLSPDGAPAASSPSPVVAAFGAVGIMGYAAGPRVHMVDEFGLGDPLAARTRFVTLHLPPGFIVPTRPGQPRRYIVIPARHRAGHEKYLPTEWVVARFAPPGVARYSGVDLSPNGVAAARRALACPDLRRLLRAVTAPMTAGRFMANVGDSFSLTSLRFSPNPEAAAGELCPKRP